MAIKASNQISMLDITDAYSVTLTSEAYTFVGNTSGAPSGLSCTTQAVAFCGTTQCSNVNISSVTCPSGISYVISNNDTASPTITFTTTSVIDDACEAVIAINVDELTFNKQFSFAVAKQGSSASDDIEIGGRNLILYENIWQYSTGTTDKSEFVYNGKVTHSNSQVNGGFKYDSIDCYKPSSNYVLSGYLTVTSQSCENVYLYNGKQHTFVSFMVDGVNYDSPLDNKITTLNDILNDGNSHYFELRYKTNSSIPSDTGALYTYIQLNKESTTYIEYEIKGLKLEKGNKATDWTPAPEDVDAKIEVKVDKDNLISEINMSAEEIALTSNRFSLESTNATITKEGNVTFKSGTIGGFTITDNTISAQSSPNGLFKVTLNKMDSNINDVTTPEAGKTTVAIQANDFKVMYDGTVYSNGNMFAANISSTSAYITDLQGKTFTASTNLTAPTATITNLTVTNMTSNGTYKFVISRVLYSGGERVNTTIPLADSVSNYNVIEVFYRTNSGDYSSVRFLSGASHFRIHSQDDSDYVWYWKECVYQISGNRFYFSKSWERNSNGDMYGASLFYIYYVVGYRFK